MRCNKIIGVITALAFLQTLFPTNIKAANKDDLFLRVKETALGIDEYSPECDLNEDGNANVFDVIRVKQERIAIYEKIEKLEADITSLKDLSSTVVDTEKLELVSERIDKLEADLIILKESSITDGNAINQELKSVSERYDKLESELAALKGSSSTVDDTDKLKQECLSISNKISELETNIDSLKNLSLECDINGDGNTDVDDIDRLKQEWLSIYDKISELKTDIALLKESSSTVAEKIGDIEKDIAAQTARIDMIENTLSERKVLLDYGTITTSNYQSLLPDLNDAESDSIYVLNFSASGEKPLNVPDVSKSYNVSLLITTGGVYKTQTLIDSEFIYKRNYSYNWTDWKQSYSKESIVATPSTLISLLKKYNNSKKNIYLSSGEYDVFQMYIDYFGADYWDNYEGYEGDKDVFTNGLWLDNISLIGLGDVSFVFNGETNEAIQKYFSFFALSGESSIQDITCDIGMNKLRYAIHDDYAGHNSKISYDGLILKGTPYAGALIGAGFKRGCTYKINNCIFLDNEKDEDIAYHSASDSDEGCQIIISNCYGNKDVVFRWYGTSTVVNQCIVNNCKFRNIRKQAHTFNPHDIDNINLIKYCNEETTDNH